MLNASGGFSNIQFSPSLIEFCIGFRPPKKLCKQKKIYCSIKSILIWVLRVIVGPFRERRNNKLFIERERKKNKSAYLSIIKVMAEIPIANTINIYLSIIGYVDFFLAPDFTRCSFCIKCKKTQGNTKKKTYTCATK